MGVKLVNCPCERARIRRVHKNNRFRARPCLHERRALTRFFDHINVLPNPIPQLPDDNQSESVIPSKCIANANV